MELKNSLEILGENGILKKFLHGFTPRIPQQEMAIAIEKTILSNAELIVEAETGAGKTFGYLVPAFLAGKKTIISTGTKNLQDQLFLQDIPLIQRLLNKPFKSVLLKGRANYLCLHRLKQNREDGRFTSRELIKELEIIFAWRARTKTGDIAELEIVQEDSAIWPLATSTPDNCLRQECDFYKECFVVKARQEALAADLVVVNHHLFFADLALQNEGFGELLPGAEVIIFDEAHHLPDIASQFFSTILTSRQLLELARDSEKEVLQSAEDIQQVASESIYLQRAVQALRNSLGEEIRGAPWPDILPQHVVATIDEVKEVLRNLEKILKVNAVRTKGLENCWKRASLLIEKFEKLTKASNEDIVHWYETHPTSFAIHQTPMIIAEQFNQAMQGKKRAWIFTSATLTVNNSFQLFKETMGLNSAFQLQLKSPFDYAKQALLYAPRNLPDTNSKFYTEAVIEAAIPVLLANQGKAFILFTSHRALEKAALYLENKIPFPILKQGTKPKRQLIEEFKKLKSAVLLGTSSFWYGVDVRGDALSCVIIDKLPFASPDDPVLQAKIKLLKKKGFDAFKELQLPAAVLILKQGAGRLIRDIEDKGILMICDPRLVGNRYGEVFLKSLPQMSRTRDFLEVRKFLNLNEFEI